MKKVKGVVENVAPDQNLWDPLWDRCKKDYKPLWC